MNGGHTKLPRPGPIIPNGDESRARNARMWDRSAGRCVFLPIRYADDFVVLVSARRRKPSRRNLRWPNIFRQTTGLELSPEKTKVTAMSDGFESLGFHFTMRWDKRYGYGPRVEIPKAKAADLRHKVKQLTTRDTLLVSLGVKLQELNLILRGWANYYRYCAHAGRVFSESRLVHSRPSMALVTEEAPQPGAHDIQGALLPSRVRPTRRVWQEGRVEQYMLTFTPVCRYRLAWMRTPDFAVSSGELDA